MPEAGWYDDPQGGGGKRWWDGERWSEHTTPPPESVPPVGTTPPPPPGAATTGTPPATAPGAAAQGGWVARPDAGAWQAGSSAASTGSSTGSAGRIVAVIVGLVVLVGLGVLAALLVTGTDEPEVVAADGFPIEVRTVEVPANGTFDLEVDLPAGMVVIDVRGLDGFDPMVELYDDRGNQIARNDDRSGDQTARFGGGFFDAMIETEVPAGRYRVTILGYADEGGTATVEFPVLGE
ncbi:MAG: DVUA0089 family protein [Nitriliruptoraceae bacterium]